VYIRCVFIHCIFVHMEQQLAVAVEESVNTE